MTEEATRPSSAVQAGPYKFLDYFSDNEQDRRRFAGRDLEIRELVALITNGSVLVVYGRSGIGKTSLILAGVFPELRERGYTPVYVRTLVDPLRDLCDALVRQCGLKEGDPGCNLRAVAGRAAESGSVAVVIDQFEEFFIRFRQKPELRAELVTAIADIVNDQDLDVTIVFSLREEYLAALDEMVDKLPNLFENRYRLRALSAFGVRQAISRPLLDSGVPYEESVVSKLVDQLDAFGFDPAVVQIICSELYKEAARRAEGKVPRITEEDLDRVGGLDGIFKRYLDGATLGIPQRLQLLARIVLDALITRESTKRAATVEDLLQSRFTASREDVEEVLTLLTEQCLLRRQARDEVWWYELMHERLIEYIEDWLNLDPDFLTFRQARIFVRNNCAGELWRGKPETLLNAEVLDGLLAPYRDRFRFEPDEVAFVLRSAIYRCSETATFWADRHGQKGAEALLKELAASPRPAERAGAATSAGRIPDPEGRLSKLCLRLVLEDPDPQVRRAAGLALAGRAKVPELRTLELALAQKSTRKNAREAFAYLREGGHPLKELGLLSRWRATRQAERHVFRGKRDDIYSRGLVGSREGALGGLAWAASAGLLLSVILVSDPNTTAALPPSWLRSVLGAMAGFTMIGALLGTILGWLAARAAAQDAAVRGEGRWFHAMLRLRVFVWIGLILSTGCFAITRESSSYLVYGAPLVLLPAFLGTLAFVSRPAVWPGLRLHSILVWSLLSSIGPPVLLLLVAHGLLTSSIEPVAVDLPFSIYIAVVFVSCASCVVPFSLARTSKGSPSTSSTGARRWSRTAIALSVLLLPVWFAFCYGFDRIPAFARNEELSHTLVWTPGPSFPDARYIRLRNPEKQVQLWKVISFEGPGTFEAVIAPNQYDKAFTQDRILSLPPGEHLARFVQQKPGGKTTVRLRRQPFAPLAPDPIPLSWGDVKTFRLPLSPAPGQRNTWSGTLRGRMALVPPASERPAFTIAAWAADSVKVRLANEPTENAVDLPRQYGPIVMPFSRQIQVRDDGTWTCDLLVVRTGDGSDSSKPPLLQIEITAGTRIES
jgi:hypothetical protein